jgi:hypothetical protein
MSLSRPLQASETQSRTSPTEPADDGQDDAADEQENERRYLEPASLSRPYPETLACVGSDVRRVAEPVEERADLRLVLRGEARPRLRDVLGDLLDELPPPRAREPSELGVEALDIVVDELVGCALHDCGLPSTN